MGLRASRILLVEDAADIREVFATLLRLEGAHVVTAVTGREAIDYAAHERFDVVVSDLGLPDVPGELVIRQIASTSRPCPRLVAMTGYGEPYASRARAAGADAVFTKPVEWSVLLRELQRASAVEPEPVAAAASRPRAALLGESTTPATCRRTSAAR